MKMFHESCRVIKMPITNPDGTETIKIVVTKGITYRCPTTKGRHIRRQYWMSRRQYKKDIHK